MRYGSMARLRLEGERIGARLPVGRHTDRGCCVLAHIAVEVEVDEVLAVSVGEETFHLGIDGELQHVARPVTRRSEEEERGLA